jgi:hypothetical protein
MVGDDALAREPGYAAISRGAERNDLLVIGGEPSREPPSAR